MAASKGSRETNRRMKVLSVNVGRPREVEWRGKWYRTSIWKAPVTGRAQVRTLNIDGDEQSDLSVHGGRHKAVYAYPSEHYATWAQELGVDLPWGAFGENLTLEGILEDEIRIGDRLTIGSVVLEVTQPRMPCFKLGIRFDRDDMVRRFLESGRSGLYLAVSREGVIAAGDEVTFESAAEHDVTIADVAEVYATGGDDRNLLRRVVAVPTLPDGLKQHFAKLLARA
jgi:MOSC domain-containing protein YiiM